MLLSILYIIFNLKSTVFLIIKNAKIRKKFLNISEQVELLKRRGLFFEDENRLRFYLKHINYYHLSAYFKTFQNNYENFKSDTSFEDILDLYNFDKKLRLLLLDILERIEISFKSVLSHDITKYRDDLYWYLPEKNNYGEIFEKIEKIIESLKNSKEIYIKHFFEKYREEKNIPAWIFFEGLTFGECSLIARNLDDSNKKTIASFYKLPKRTCIQMLHHLSILRNLCAHHSWVWNRSFTFRTSLYRKYQEEFSDIGDDSLYMLLISIQIFIKKISPNSDWLDNLEKLIDDYNIEIHRMGFPKDWKQRLEPISN